MMHVAFLPFLVFFGLPRACQGAAYDYKHMVDVPAIQCQGGPGKWEATDIGGFTETDLLVTFFRTSPQAVTVEFEMKDKAGRLAVKRQTVTLQAQSRRLSVRVSQAQVLAKQQQAESEFDSSSRLRGREEEETADVCEDFWLSDGRSPVEIPATWGEARSEFQEMCSAEGYSKESCVEAESELFEGHPSDFNTPLLINRQMCTRLLEHLSAVVSSDFDTDSVSENTVPLSDGSLMFPPLRRLKGGGATGSATRSSSSLGRSYPGGVSKAGYGYTGMGLSRGMPMRMAMVGGIGGGFLLFGGMAYYSGSYNRRRGRDQGTCQDGQEGCEVKYDVDMYRDDLLDTTFISSDYEGPFTFIVYSVTGVDYAPETVCPPSTYCEGCYLDATPTPSPTSAGCDCNSWEPPASDLFVTFSDSVRDGGEWCYDHAQGRQVLWSECSSGAECCDNTDEGKFNGVQTCPKEKEWCNDDDTTVIWVIVAIVVVIFCCGCCAIKAAMKRKRNDDAGYGSGNHAYGGNANGGNGAIVMGSVVENNRVMTITVPNDAVPGAKVTFQAPDGSPLELEIPDGVKPGSQLQVTY
jgi:hypothetical protein